MEDKGYNLNVVLGIYQMVDYFGVVDFPTDLLISQSRSLIILSRENDLMESINTCDMISRGMNFVAILVGFRKYP